jgi:hypothetical protein
VGIEREGSMPVPLRRRISVVDMDSEEQRSRYLMKRVMRCARPGPLLEHHDFLCTCTFASIELIPIDKSVLLVVGVLCFTEIQLIVIRLFSFSLPSFLHNDERTGPGSEYMNACTYKRFSLALQLVRQSPPPTSAPLAP